MKNNKCWICLRITPAFVLKYAHKVWSNPKIARQIGLEASKIMEEAYHQKPPLLCGKSPRGLVAGLFYILGQRHDPLYKNNGRHRRRPISEGEKIRRTQREISEQLEVEEVTVRNRWFWWIETFPSLFPDFQYDPIYGWCPKKWLESRRVSS